MLFTDRDNIILHLVRHNNDEYTYKALRDWYEEFGNPYVAKIINLMLFFDKYPRCSYHLKSNTEEIEDTYWYFSKHGYSAGIPPWLEEFIFGVRYTCHRNLTEFLEQAAKKLEGFIRCIL